MNDKKFDIISITVSIAAVLISFFGFIVESFVFAGIALVLCYRRKEKYRTKIAVAFSIIAIIGSTAFLALMCYLSSKTGMPVSDYWLIELIF